MFDPRARQVGQADAASDTDVLHQGLPVIQIDARRIDDGMPITELFFTAGLTASNSEARRLIRAGGARLNDVRLDDETRLVGHDDISEGHIKLSSGKKRHVLLRPV